MVLRVVFKRNIFFIWIRILVFCLVTMLIFEGKVIGLESLGEALKLNQQIIQLCEVGNYKEAIPLAKRALTIRENILGSDHVDVAESLNILALLYIKLNNYDRAKTLYRRALVIWEREFSSDDLLVASGLSDTGKYYNQIGEYSLAKRLLTRALDILEKIFGPDHPHVAIGLSNLAELYYDLHDYGHAVLLHKKALEIRENRYGPKDPIVASSLNFTGLCYIELGEYCQAGPLFRRALEIRKNKYGSNHPHVVSVQNNIAILYSHLGDYDRAEQLFNRSLSILEYVYGSNHPIVAKLLINLAAIIQQSQGNYDRVEALYKRALAIFEKAYGNDNRSVDAARGNLAVLYLDQRKLDKAYEIFKEGAWFSGMGQYYLLKADYHLAYEQFKKARDFSNESRLSTELLASYIGLGLSLEGLKRYQEAAESYYEAVELIEDQRAELIPADRTHFLNGEVEVGFKRILAYEGLVRTKEKLKDPASAFLWAEHTKARLLIEAIAHGKSSPGLPSDLAETENSLTTRLTGLYRQREETITKNPTLFKKIDEEDLPAAKEELARFVKSLRENYPVYAAIRYPEPIPVAELDLEPQESLVVYEVTEQETFAWLIRQGKIIKDLTIPVARKNLTEQVKRYRGFFEGITRYSHLSSYDPVMGKELYDLLVKDLAAHIKQNERVIIIPDDILGILPFETLVAELPARAETVKGKYGAYPTGLRYLCDIYPISYYQSATALSFARTLRKTESADTEKMLVVADPVFGITDARLEGKSKTLVAQRDEYHVQKMQAMEEALGGVGFDRVAATGRLAESLRLSYGNVVDVLKGLKATEKELRDRSLSEYRYQVFATHGILDDQVPYIQEPALVLSQVGVDTADRDNDGFLTMTEVMDLKLDADVAALTACNTGVGKNLTGEGVMGMGRAFQYAGARSVLMSLWSVEEASTSFLIEKFFIHLKEHKDKLEALRLARADVRKAGYEHPYFWAPFILIGETCSGGSSPAVSFPIPNAQLSKKVQ